MPELNPLSNEQIFLKKIAENTGSDYNTGDVSEINPLTIDQIFLKEIAANTAGGVEYYEVQGTTDSYGQLGVDLNLNRVTGIFVKDPVCALAVRATSGNTLQIWAVNNSSATADTLKQIRNESVSLMITALPNSEV